MTDFGHISKDEKEEWLRHPVTAAALSMLRELEAALNASVIAEAKSTDATLHSIGVQVGRSAGLNLAIDQLTRMPK